MLYCLTWIILQAAAASLWFEILVQGAECLALSGGTTRLSLAEQGGALGRNDKGSSAPARGQSVFVAVGVLSRAITGKHTRLSRRPQRAARPDHLAWRSTKPVQADPRPFLDRSVNAAACRIHVFQNFKQ